MSNIKSNYKFLKSAKCDYNILMPEDMRKRRIDGVLNSAGNFKTRDFTIMYLIARLSQYFQRSPEYFLKTEPEQYQIFLSDFGIVRDGPDQFVVCKTICEKFKKYFDEFGIESQIVELPTKSSIPLYAMLVTGDGGKTFFIDPLSDLQMNQFGLKMDYFGDYSDMHRDSILLANPNAVQLPREYINQLESQFDDLYYGNQNRLIDMHNFYSKRLYDGTISTKRDTEIARINSMEQKVRLISDEISNMSASDIPVTGIIERRKLYQMLLNRYTFFTRKEKNGGNGIKFFINRAGEYPSINCIIFGSNGEEEVQYREMLTEGEYVLKRVNASNPAIRHH